LSVLLRFKASDYPFGVLDVRFLTIPSKKNRQHNGQKYKDTKGVVRGRKSKITKG
jgi:hypothetical protein